MIKLYFEDADLEEFVLSGESDIAIPIQVTQSADGEVSVTAYLKYKLEAEQFCRVFAADPFSDGAKEYLESVFSPLMKKLGYRFEREYDQTVLSYEAECGKLQDVPCDAKIIFIGTNEELSSLYLGTTRDFEIDDDDPADVAFAAVQGNVALSVATVNDYSEDGSVEINVETAKNERDKGYGAAVTSALCRHLLSLGERVSYRCRASNGASRRVAEKCGLTYKGKTFYYLCYKI